VELSALFKRLFRRGPKVVTGEQALKDLDDEIAILRDSIATLEAEKAKLEAKAAQSGIKTPDKTIN
jgi:hypothetical protein